MKHVLRAAAVAAAFAASQGTALEVCFQFSTESMMLLDVDVDTEYSGGRTPLHVAVQDGCFDFARMLLERGADTDAADEDGRTPLHYAAERRHAFIARMLLNEGADTDAADEDGRTPLHEAAENGHAFIALMLLGAEADPFSAWLPELSAIAADELMRLGAEAELPELDEGAVPMSASEAAIARTLLEIRDDPYAPDEDGRTPLSYAAERRHAFIARMLLGVREKGADPDAPDEDGRTPLSYAAESGHAFIARMLLEAEADPDAPDEDGRTPRDWAAESGHAFIARMLLEAEANLPAAAESGNIWSIADNDFVLGPILSHKCGDTPLHEAARLGRTDVMRMLLEEGGNQFSALGLLLEEEGIPHSVDERGWRGRLLHSVDERGWSGPADVVRMLLEARANPDAPNKFGLTPLHCAALGGHADVVRTLLEEGANPTATDALGRTPLRLAAWQDQFGLPVRYAAVVELLAAAAMPDKIDPLRHLGIALEPGYELGGTESKKQ